MDVVVLVVVQINSGKPFNAEPPSELLVEGWVTPNELFFKRNHLPVPDIKLHDYRLEGGDDQARRKS